MLFKATANCLFNDIWCYLVIECFDWRIGIFQQTIVKGLLYPQMKVFEWKWYFCIKPFKLINQSKTERKSKWQNELIVNSWINISLLQNHPATGDKIEIFEWKNNNWVKLLKGFNLKMKSLDKSRNIKYK